MSEFGEDYAVPASLTMESQLEGGTLVDTSWHNDLWPSFVAAIDANDTTGIRLWVAHPDMAVRVAEVGQEIPRYTVCNENGDILYEGDDIGEAVSVLKRVTAEAITDKP